MAKQPTNQRTASNPATTVTQAPTSTSELRGVLQDIIEWLDKMMPTVVKVPNSGDKAEALSAIQQYRTTSQETLVSQETPDVEGTKSVISEALGSIMMRLVSQLPREILPISVSKEWVYSPNML
jgi:hypothetical protein